MTNHIENTETTEFGRILQAALADAEAKRAAAETPEQERERLIATIQEQKLPGFGLASRWSIETLRSKVAETKKAKPQPKKIVETAKVVAEPTTVVADVTETPVVEVAESTTTVAETPVVKSDELTEANGFVVGQIVPAKVAAKLSYGVLVNLNDTNTSALLHVDEMAGGTFFARSQRNKDIA
ncbi:MAG: hypothetical protein K8F91_12535, partial [Candidatus Obscuribacterales bacterium]|nr:hypothetical protein [Candidatus Obscuribacterales bacterium]